MIIKSSYYAQVSKLMNFLPMDANIVFSMIDNFNNYGVSISSNDGRPWEFTINC